MTLTYPLLSPAVLLELGTNQLISSKLGSSVSLILPAFCQLSACPADLPSSTAVLNGTKKNGNGLVNTTSHPPTQTISQSNRIT